MMKTLLVAKREFLATVLTKGFLLGILLPPIIGGGMLFLMPILMNSAATKTRGTIAVIDQSGLLGDAIAKHLSANAFQQRVNERIERTKQKLGGSKVPIDPRAQAMMDQAAQLAAPTLDVKVLPPTANVDEEKKPVMLAKVRDAESAPADQRIALVVIPEGTVKVPAELTDETKFTSYQLFVAPKLDIEVRSDISRQVDRAIVDARLKQIGTDPERIRRLTVSPETDTRVVTAEGERQGSEFAEIMIPGAFMILLWVSVLVGGQGLLMSTIEEKSSRVMEVILSAVSPMELMVGKIIGQMAVASLILALYATTGVGALVFFAMNHLLDPMLLVYAIIYFIIAFFLLASIMAAIGSVVNDIREAQVLMQPIMLVMVIPMALWLPISRNPNGLFAQIVSFIPPASPFVMIIRLAGKEPIPMWQVPASILVGFAAMAFMCWAAAKIFRIGVLMTGKPPNLRTLVKWVRMA
jgi:ABC-type Na+ efflux pump permease subunit